MKDKLALKVAIIVAVAVLLGFVAAVSTVGIPASPEPATGEIGSWVK